MKRSIKKRKSNARDKDDNKDDNKNNKDEKLIQLIEKRELGEEPMNFLLVLHGARKASLLETSNYDADLVTKLLTLAKDVGLHVTRDPLSIDEVPRYWIYKSIRSIRHIPQTDEEIGSLLGFKEPGGDFSNAKEGRKILIIEEKSGRFGTVEIVNAKTDDIEIEKWAETKVKQFNQVMSKLDLPYRFDYGIQHEDGTLKRAKELEQLNVRYIQKNRHHYINDMWNELDIEQDHPFLILFQHIIKNKKLLSTYQPFFSYVYKLIHGKELEGTKTQIDKMIVDRKKKLFKKFSEIFM